MTTMNAPEPYGAYLLEGRISASGNGDVFRARHVPTRRAVALKRFLPHMTEDPAVRAMMLEHMTPLLALAPHPNVVSVLDVGLVGETLYVAMELVEGFTFADASRGRQMPVAEVLAAGVVLCRALAHVHAAGFIHRNVGAHKLLGAKLAGTGMPTASPRSGSSLFSRSLRTMSPEQVRGMALDPRADQFATAVVLWEALAGRRLFDGRGTVDVLTAIVDGVDPIPPPSSVRADVPSALDAAIARALSRKTEHRFDDMNGFAAALTTAQG